MSDNEVKGDTASFGTGAENDYTMRQGQKGGPVPVVGDGDVKGGVNEATADSDAQLAKDDKEAIDESNIIEERTRGAKPEDGTYTEPGDEEGLGGPDDGVSRVSGGPN